MVAEGFVALSISLFPPGGPGRRSVKFSIDKYNISKDYENRLRERAALFRYLTKNKKSLVHTFITTYGVANGKNKSIVHSEVTMDNLFS